MVNRNVVAVAVVAFVGFILLRGGGGGGGGGGNGNGNGGGSQPGSGPGAGGHLFNFVTGGGLTGDPSTSLFNRGGGGGGGNGFSLPKAPTNLPSTPFLNQGPVGSGGGNGGIPDPSAPAREFVTGGRSVRETFMSGQLSGFTGDPDTSVVGGGITGSSDTNVAGQAANVLNPFN